MMLTTNQAILLRQVCGSPEPPSTGSLAALKNEHGHEFGDNAARNAMHRLEARGFVVGSGVGRSKSWASTPAGTAALSELAPEIEPVTPDADPEQGIRTYIVLEELTLADAIREALPDDVAVPDTVFAALEGKRVYDAIASPEARNTEHAYRQTAKAMFPDVDAEPTLVAVADKMFRPTVVKVRNRQQVTIG